MRVGDVVIYVDPDGVSRETSVTAIVGSGASGYKLLDLSYGDDVAVAVAHAGDRERGCGYWQLRSEQIADPVMTVDAEE